MRLISETNALARLDRITLDLRTDVAAYEHKAKNCGTCSTPGACCLDEHFVNVRITRLEAVRIRKTLAGLPYDLRRKVDERTETAIERLGLTDHEAADAKFACPLFEKGIGCLVHNGGKPVPCVVHACYESPADLPPDELLSKAEAAMDLVNRKTYGVSQPLLPLPLAIRS